MDIFDPGGFFGLGGIVQRWVYGLQFWFQARNITNPIDFIGWLVGSMLNSAWEWLLSQIHLLPQHIPITLPNPEIFYRVLYSLSLFDRILPMNVFFAAFGSLALVQLFIWTFRFYRYLKAVNPFAPGA